MTGNDTFLASRADFQNVGSESEKMMARISESDNVPFT